MERSSLISFCLIAPALLTVALIAPAQVGRGQDKGGGGLQIAKVTGTLKAMQQNKIKIAAEDKKEYFAVLNEQTSLQYRGTAESDFLAPGLLVRFSAELNQNGHAQTPVTELEVFALNQNQNHNVSPEEAREQTPGVYQVGGEASNLKKTPPRGSAKSTKQKAAPGGDAQTYRVVGQVTQIQAGKVFVQAGNVGVQMELDPKAAITVSARDMTFCQMGDQVKVSGLRNAGDPFINSETLEITGAKPLGPAEGKVSKNGKNSKTARGKNVKAGADKNAADKVDADKAANGKEAAESTRDKKADSRKPVPKKPTSVQ